MEFPFKKCFIISEIGVNHNGDIDLAKKMIKASKESGADAVKFQTFTADSLVSRMTPKVDYQKNTTDENESHYEMIKSLEMSKEDHKILLDFCIQEEIEFISTPYDVDSAEFLNKIGVKFFKTASADIVDIPLHEFLADTGKPIIISTGMATLDEIDQVIDIYKSKKNMNITLLHCVSNYPCKLDSLNMSVINSLKERYNLGIGYSDHAKGYLPSVAAVALGSRVIEKHFTLDKNLPGPDHKASSTPDEFRELVEAIRSCEIFMGSPKKTVQEEEKQMKKVSRKSLFFKNDMKKGNVIKENDITLKRPGTGLYAKYIPEIIGKTLLRNVEGGTMVSLEHIK